LVSKGDVNELILNFGDIYDVAKVLENSVYSDCIKNVLILPNGYDALFSLIRRVLTDI
jgi:hypothetical protein